MTWTLKNDNEDITINLDEGAPDNVKHFLKASKVVQVDTHKYRAVLYIINIQAAEDDLDVHFQITNFLKYPEEVFHLVIKVSEENNLDTAKTVIIVLLGLLFSVGACINFIYCIKSFTS